MFTRTTVAIAVAMVYIFPQPAGAAQKFPDYPVRSAGDYAIKIERAGLVIGVEPVEDLKDQKSYFSAETTPKGFIPVFIVIQNGSSGESFLFERSNVGYAGVSSNSTPNAKSKVGEGMAMAGLTGIVAMKLITNATQIQQNILKKEVQSKTLSPGTSVHGFLYIPVPKKGPREKIHLQVPISTAGTSETFVLNLYF